MRNWLVAMTYTLFILIYEVARTTFYSYCGCPMAWWPQTILFFGLLLTGVLCSSLAEKHLRRWGVR